MSDSWQDHVAHDDRRAYTASTPRWSYLRELALATAILSSRAPHGLLDGGIGYWILHRSTTTERGSHPAPGTQGSMLTRTSLMLLTAKGQLTVHHFAEHIVNAKGHAVCERLHAEDRALDEVDLELLDLDLAPAPAAGAKRASEGTTPSAFFTLRPGVRRKGDGLVKALIDLAADQSFAPHDRLAVRDITRAEPGRRTVRNDLGAVRTWLIGDEFQQRLGLAIATLMILTTPVLDVRPILWAVIAMTATISYVVYLMYVDWWERDRTDPLPVPALKGTLLALGATATYVTFMWFDESPTCPMRLFQFFDWHGVLGFAALLVVFAICSWLVAVSLVVAYRNTRKALREPFTLRQTVIALAPAVVVHTVASAVGLAACAGLVYR